MHRRETVLRPMPSNDRDGNEEPTVADSNGAHDSKVVVSDTTGLCVPNSASTESSSDRRLVLFPYSSKHDSPSTAVV
jgi:hypothetical protein